MSPALSVLTRPAPGGRAVELVATGSLTGSTRDALAAEIATARGPGAAVPVVVDLTGVQQIDPSALELLRADVDDLELLGREEGEEPDADPVQVPVLFLVPETTRAGSLERTVADSAP